MGWIGVFPHLFAAQDFLAPVNHSIDLSLYVRKEASLSLLRKEKLVCLLGQGMANVLPFLILEGVGYSKHSSGITTGELVHRDPYEAQVGLIGLFMLTRDVDHYFSEDATLRLNAQPVHATWVAYDFNRSFAKEHQDFGNLLSDEGKKIWLSQWARILVQNKEISQKVLNPFITHWKSKSAVEIRSLVQAAGIEGQELEFYVAYLKHTIAHLKEDIQAMVKACEDQVLFQKTTKVKINSRDLNIEVASDGGEPSVFDTFQAFRSVVGDQKAVQFLSGLVERYEQSKGDDRTRDFLRKFLLKIMEVQYAEDFQRVRVQGKEIRNFSDLERQVTDSLLLAACLSVISVTLQDEASVNPLAQSLLISLASPDVLRQASVGAGFIPSSPSEDSQRAKEIETRVEEILNEDRKQIWIDYRSNILQEATDLVHAVVQYYVVAVRDDGLFETPLDFAFIAQRYLQWGPQRMHDLSGLIRILNYRLGHLTWGNIHQDKQLRYEVTNAELASSVTDEFVREAMRKEATHWARRFSQDTEQRANFNIPNGFRVEISVSENALAFQVKVIPPSQSAVIPAPVVAASV